jgi:hypothetical protein
MKRVASSGGIFSTWSIGGTDGDHLAPSTSTFMVNCRVAGPAGRLETSIGPPAAQGARPTRRPSAPVAFAPPRARDPS